MLERRISFYCGEAGLPSYQLNQLKKLTAYFQSTVELFNVRQCTRVPVSQPLKMLSLANKPYALCQLIINGSDAELASFVLTDFIAQYGISLAQLSPSLPFELNFSLASIDVGRGNKAETISQLSQLLAQQQAITSEQQPALQHALFARETVSATVMGPSIALPHVMHAMIAKPAMAIVCHQKSIDWGSSRGNITRAIAMILPKPPLKQVIMAFSQFSKCLLNDDYCAALSCAKTPLEINALVVETMR